MFFNISKNPQNILIFRITFGNPCSRAETDYYQLSPILRGPIRYFLPQKQLNMVNFHKYSIWGMVASHIFMWHILKPVYFLQNLLARGNKNGTVLDYFFFIVICEKKDTIKYSNKIEKFCQIAELWVWSQVKTAFLISWKIEFLCLFAIRDEVTGEKSSNLRGNYSRQRRLPKYSFVSS